MCRENLATQIRSIVLPRCSRHRLCGWILFTIFCHSDDYWRYSVCLLAMFRRVWHSASGENSVQQERHGSSTVFGSSSGSEW